VPRVAKASRRLFVLGSVLAALVLPASAASEPAISFDHHIEGTVGANGWYVSNVHVYWTWSPPPDSASGCDPRILTADGATHFDCNAWWGTTHLEDEFDVRLDKTPPTASGHPGRPPDANGWYNHPVAVSFSGSDATSRLAGCSSTTYSGPDNDNASVAGTCTDNAGNVGRATLSLAYDATPPTLGAVTVKHGNRKVMLKWTVSPDTQRTQVTRSGGGAKGPKQVYDGTGHAFQDKGLRVGAKYRYTVTAFDPAANPAAKTMAVTATGRLINPVPGERVTSPPYLAWLPVKGASYYNVQLIRGGRILSAWPKRAAFKLPRSWVYHGQRYRLKPGVYRWYVWPGFGKLAQARYGARLGGSVFVYGRR
jgi:hypothetical protein